MSRFSKWAQKEHTEGARLSWPNILIRLDLGQT